MARCPPPLVLLTCLLALGCGSRSGLLGAGIGGAAGTPSGGSPSGGTSSGGTGGGGTGSGGAPVGGSAGVGPCNVLVQVDPVLTPADTTESPLDDGMRLTATSEDGRQVTAVFLRKTAPDLFSLRHATLRPWESWPSNGELGPIHAPGIETISNLSLSRSVGESWAAAVRANDGPRLYREIAPAAGGPAVPTTPLPGIDPMFVSRQLGGSGSHLVGTFDVVVGGQVIRATWVDSFGASKELSPLGCASGQAPRADAVPFADRWLVAYSRQAGSPSCPNTFAGPPTDLDVVELGPTGVSAPLASVADIATIVDLHAAPHPGGIYVVWSTASMGPSVGFSLLALRVDGSTGTAAGPVALFPGDASQTSFNIGAVGKQLVVARRLGFEAIEVTVFDESLAALTSLTLPSGTGSFPTAVYGSPGGEGVVVGWTENSQSEFRVHLARLDCLP